MTDKTGSRIIYRGPVGNVYEVAWKSVPNTLRFDFNPMRHMHSDELKRFARAMWKKAYPDHPEKRRARELKHYYANKDKINAKKKEQRDAKRKAEE